MPDLEKIAKVKRHVDRISREKVQMDAQTEMLLAENKRIYKELKQEMLDISSLAEGDAKMAELDKEIDEYTEKQVKILREIGVNI